MRIPLENGKHLETQKKEHYRREIIEIIKNMEDARFLKFFYEMLVSFKKKWGI